MSVAADLELSVPATRVALSICLDGIGHFAEAGKLDADLTARLRIIVEELFLNTIKYGYGGECQRQVRLWLSRARSLTLVYEDDAPPFDPTRWTATRDQAITVARLREGQAGIALLFGLASSVTYEGRTGVNRLVVTFDPR
jgi:anti-sigma regulatory factor (Ser/Thr protein kinase)